jgi:serine O-acetyltransferase
MSERPVSSTRSAGVAACDPVWGQIRKEAEQAAAAEPALAAFLHATVLGHESLERGLSLRLAQLLESADVDASVIREVFDEAYSSDASIRQALRADICAVFDRDPACSRYIDPILYFKGFQALQTHRVAHWLWNEGRRDFGYYLQSRASKVYGVDIHPAAPIGRGVFFDHASGIVIGETAVIEDDVSMLHGVTLGGTGKRGGDRHPKVRSGALIGAGAKILGNIEVGACARVAAGSVVLKPVPPRTTVAGVPARVVGEAGCPEPARTMDHRFPGTGSGDI